MTTRRDLVDANAFSRRRLVTAFTSGSCGCVLEPVRTGRTIVGGLVLAVLLVAGAAIVRTVSPSLPEDWSSAHADSDGDGQVTGPGR